MSEELEAARVIARRQIENLMARYEYLHSAGRDGECAQLFAEQTPGVRLAIAQLGIYDGVENVRRFFEQSGKIGPDRRGVLIVHTLTTPVIEVAGDGLTAQGVWISPGVETVPGGHTAPAQLEDGVWVSAEEQIDLADQGFRATWAWVRYGVDFVVEDGEWRIWRLAIHRLFTALHDQDWLDTLPRHLPPFPDELKPNRANPHDWVFSRDAVIENVPAPPKRYETWDEARAYVR